MMNFAQCTVKLRKLIKRKLLKLSRMAASQDDVRKPNFSCLLYESHTIIIFYVSI